MVDDLDYTIKDYARADSGLISRADVAYETSLEEDTAQITLGVEEGSNTVEEVYNSDDILYTITLQGRQESGRGEVKVPEHLAKGSLENFTENVLEKYAETDRSEEWNMEGLKTL